MALPTLPRAASRRRICAVRRELTAMPAASSAGLTILLPELRRESDLLRSIWLDSRLWAETWEVMLVLMIIGFYFGALRVAGDGIFRPGSLGRDNLGVVSASLLLR